MFGLKAMSPLASATLSCSSKNGFIFVWVKVGARGVATCPESEKHGIEQSKPAAVEGAWGWPIPQLMMCMSFKKGMKRFHCS
jgi:phenylpropionate dioxygenase-like ring-hydroxylating dioxygenase large terminal subunit